MWRYDIFKLLLNTLLKGLFIKTGEILSLVNPSNLAKTEKTHRSIRPEQERNPVQISHPSKATFKFPPSRAQCTVKCPRYARGGGGMFTLQFDRYITVCLGACPDIWDIA